MLLRDVIAGKRPNDYEPGAPTFIIASYDWLVRHAANLKTHRHYDLGICDEAHALKSPDTKRTRLLYGPRCTGDGLLARCARTILLTGTPAPNGHPSELWPHLRCLASSLIGGQDYDSFIRRYCEIRVRQIETRFGTKTIEQICGANRYRAPELAHALTPFWHRPPLDEIERDLPPLRLVIRRLPVELLDGTAIQKLEQSPEADALREAIKTGNLRGIEGHMTRLRRLLALAKVKATIAWVKDALEEQGESKIIAVGLAHRATRAAARRLGRLQAAPDRRRHAAARARRRRGGVPERARSARVRRPDPGSGTIDHTHCGATRDLPRAGLDAGSEFPGAEASAPDRPDLAGARRGALRARP